MINRDRKFKSAIQNKNDKIIHFSRTIYFSNPKITKITLYLDNNSDISSTILHFSNSKTLDQFKKQFESSPWLTGTNMYCTYYMSGEFSLYVSFKYSPSKRDFSPAFHLIHEFDSLDDSSRLELLLLYNIDICDENEIRNKFFYFKNLSLSIDHPDLLYKFAYYCLKIFPDNLDKALSCIKLIPEKSVNYRKANTEAMKLLVARLQNVKEYPDIKLLEQAFIHALRAGSQPVTVELYSQLCGEKRVPFKRISVHNEYYLLGNAKKLRDQLSRRPEDLNQKPESTGYVDLHITSVMVILH